jgi:hypothetical protein
MALLVAPFVGVFICPTYAQSIVVTIYFVDIVGIEIDPKFYACGDSSVAGPFMSGATAVEWRNEFAMDAEIIISYSDDLDACLPPPAWYHNSDIWYAE